jgi:hypothetical protein
MLSYKNISLFFLSFSIAHISIAAQEEEPPFHSASTAATSAVSVFKRVSSFTPEELDRLDDVAQFRHPSPGEPSSLEEFAAQNAQSFKGRWKQSLQEARLLEDKRLVMKGILKEAEEALEEMISVLPPKPTDVRTAILGRRPPSETSSSEEEESSSEEDACIPSTLPHTKLWEDVLAHTPESYWALTASAVLTGLCEDIERCSLDRLLYEDRLRHKNGKDNE